MQAKKRCEVEMIVDKNTVAICMATYNGQDYLKQQIDSVINQSYKDWVLFVRDDNSKDNTSQIIKEFTELYPDRIINIHKQPNNKGSRENFGLVLDWIKSNYDFSYYMFCDQDDVWNVDKIEKTLNKMREVENTYNCPVLIHTDLEVVDSNLNTLGQSFFKYRALDPNVKDLNHLLAQNNITGCTMMWNKRLNQLVNLMDNNIVMHDWWIGLVACCFGKIDYVNEATIKYRQHETNVVGATKVNTISFIFNRLFNNNHVKETLKLSIKQADAFKRAYKNQLSKEQYEILDNYSTLYNHSKIVRIIKVLKYGFLKQGIIQIIGQLLFI